jgi:hypothetical protein
VVVHAPFLESAADVTARAHLPCAGLLEEVLVENIEMRVELQALHAQAPRAEQAAAAHAPSEVGSEEALPPEARTSTAATVTASPPATQPSQSTARRPMYAGTPPRRRCSLLSSRVLHASACPPSPLQDVQPMLCWTQD